jgi:mannose-6-phosphate isomerase-like protein (cupin superfamily)
MFTQTTAESPKNRRGGGQVSSLLLAPGQFGAEHLAITWVDAEPGSRQPFHSHPDCEQVYVIVAGRGQMIVAGEEREVREGVMVFIPPGAEHAIRNPGPERLTYVSATSPPFQMPTGELGYEPAGAGE